MANPYHDPKSGEFTTSSGGGAGEASHKNVPAPHGEPVKKTGAQLDRHAELHEKQAHFHMSEAGQYGKGSSDRAFHEQQAREHSQRARVLRAAASEAYPINPTAPRSEAPRSFQHLRGSDLMRREDNVRKQLGRLSSKSKTDKAFHLKRELDDIIEERSIRNKEGLWPHQTGFEKRK